MKQSKGDQGNEPPRGLIAQTGPGASAGDRVCSQCGMGLSWGGESGALETCRCDFCQRDVKPKFRTAHERATAFRNTVRELLKVNALPARVTEELRACWHRSIWTNLAGSDLKPFKTFDDFCRDPAGLGCDPVPVKAILEKWVGAAAFALGITPVAQQGRRTDRLEGTSRRNGDKSRPARTDSRHRAIHRGPQVLAQAVGSNVLGKMNAEFLASYGAKNPGCTRFAEIVRQLEAGVAKPKAERVSSRIAVSGQVQALKNATQSPSRRSRKKPDEVTPPPMAADSGETGAPLTKPDRLCSAQAAAQGAATSALGGLPSTDMNDSAEPPVLLQRALGRGHDQNAARALELRASFFELLRAWRQMVALVGDDLDLRGWLALFENATDRVPGTDDEELLSRLEAELSRNRSSGTTERVREVSPPVAGRRQDMDERWAAPYLALAPAAE